jgi:hypothetical protein
MVPERLSGEGGEGVRGVSHEASSGMGVESQHKWNKQVMCIPKSLIGLLANAMVGGGIHEHHAQKHDMPSDTTCLGKVDLDCSLRADLIFFEVVEASMFSKGNIGGCAMKGLT